MTTSDDRPEPRRRTNQVVWRNTSGLHGLLSDRLRDFPAAGAMLIQHWVSS